DVHSGNRAEPEEAEQAQAGCQITGAEHFRHAILGVVSVDRGKCIRLAGFSPLYVPGGGKTSLYNCSMMEVDPLIGKQLASFRIERVQGRGGMATVYYGWDVKLERPVAIKVIATHYAGDAAYAARFVNEARA